MDLITATVALIYVRVCIPPATNFEKQVYYLIMASLVKKDMREKRVRKTKHTPQSEVRAMPAVKKDSYRPQPVRRTCIPSIRSILLILHQQHLSANNFEDLHKCEWKFTCP
ncbi:hypothetical protein [Ethanoligenens harbinense]|uniref:hypothetical protein n=1 Tax=Ethanoligenens harbinense TaxID=253239 RepID=UPI00030AA38D|nr:hypothetical protein [Ethanoligenens harbinense]AVQ96291.1 hypothetical protein CXQ68_08690 [Ethanoligenens harbinense YUAN-3]AYF38950.1 hypothetical protein CXP51_08560 [Ethanoligenens harbinense]AYF41702.1 hypothetical protein CN246_08710 [Ethanoligenens harbinense]QCN92532.1 hypothetical protein DRA42_08720 [Ethanoligenens harbinense]